MTATAAPGDLERGNRRGMEMGLLAPVERDALTEAISRRRRLWAMHEATETLAGPPRTLSPGYTDTELLYAALTSGFDDADEEARSRDELAGRVEALARRLESDYATALADARGREEFSAMVTEMLTAIRGR